MIYCSNCGKSIPADSKFCAFCGAAVPAIATEKVVSKTIRSRPYSFADHRGDFIRSAGFWGSLLVLVGFFLPWMHDATSISGLDIVNHGHKWGRFTLLIFPVCALFVLVDSLTNFLPSGAATFFKILPFLLLIVITILIVVVNKHEVMGVNKINTNDFNTLIKIPGIGMWLTFIGTIIMLAHKKYKRVIVNSVN